MQKLLTYFLFALSILTSSIVNANITEGKDYTRLPTAQPTTPGKIEVIEFFWYGCSHCYTIEPYIDAWAKKLPTDVIFRREHIAWPGRADLIPHAKLYYTLNTMGLTHKLDAFKAIQQDRLELRREDTLFDWVAKEGVDVKQFKNVYHSFGTQSQVARAQDMTKRYAINAVPTFVVNGKYQTSPGLIGKEDGTITTVLDALITKERKQK